MNSALINELKQESKSTEALLMSIPEDKFSWQPHAKSMTAGKLAQHIATIPSEILVFFTPEVLDCADIKPSGEAASSQKELLTTFNSSIAKTSEILSSWSDEFLTQEWSMVKDGEAIMAMPRIAGLRTMLLNHLYHHRGQLSVYLRLLDIPVPSVYGPTADVNPFA